ncbi:MAG: 4-hydroxy-tetrahydrodipicolinate synthase [Pseudomonadota bacterium]|nr:4-hydroxy-tetrahydrodipicolinate synthase [Pseudomonadota bacterium]
MIQGSIVALVTPMHADGGVDWDGLARLVEFHIENHTDAIVSVGTTGESATLNFVEHLEVIRRTVELVKGRIPVIGGTGANSTTEAIELTRGAKEAGVDACLLVCPYYIKPTQEGIYRHHRAVAEAVAVPQILYNVPGRTAVDMKPETIVRLSQVAHIFGVKEATGDISRVGEILSRSRDGFIVYSGDDATAAEAILSGAKGDISVTANVAPRSMHDLCAAAMTGDRETAMGIDQSLRGLHRDLFVEPSPIPVKWALHKMGLIEEGIRLPLTPLTAESRPKVVAALQQAGIEV